MPHYVACVCEPNHLQLFLYIFLFSYIYNFIILSFSFFPQLLMRRLPSFGFELGSLQSPDTVLASSVSLAILVLARQLSSYSRIS